MFNFIKKYWFESIVLVVIATVLLLILPNGFTWMNTDSDGAHYTMAAKYFTTAHHTSAPLFLLLGHVFLQIPFMSEAWRFGLLLVLSTIVACVFIYLIVRYLLKDSSKAKWLSILAMLIYGGSALTISQSTIIDTYAFDTMLSLAGYYFCLKNRWVWASVMFGLGLATHPIVGFTWVVMFVAYKEMRNWKRWGLTALFLLFYLYIPIVKLIGHDNGMWANTTASGFFEGTYGAIVMLTGGLSIWDFPQRVLNTILILLASVGLGIVPAIYYLVKKKTWHNALLWLTLIPIIYFLVDLANEVYVYMLPAIAWLSILASLGLSKLNVKWLYATGVVAITLLSINFVYFNSLDQSSAMKFYHDLDKIPDGQYFMGSGWNWAMVYVYDKEENRNVIPISQDALVSPQYQKELDKMGIKYVVSNDTEEITKEGEMAVSVATLNDNIWIAKDTKPEIYQVEIVPSRGNEAYVGRWIGQSIKPEWRWIPSNPWKFISGSLEVSQWNHVLRSNRNMMHVMAYGLFGFMLFKVIMSYKKKKVVVVE